VQQAKRDSGQLRMVGETLPIGAAVAGFVLAAVGGVLVVRGRKRPEPTDTTVMPEPALTM
jgi:hypothetical protein